MPTQVAENQIPMGEALERCFRAGGFSPGQTQAIRAEWDRIQAWNDEGCKQGGTYDGAKGPLG
jgi:hypothetical protein